jgi:hypothetical protein
MTLTKLDSGVSTARSWVPPVPVDVELGIVPQVNRKDLGELLDAKQSNGDSNTFQEMTICLVGTFG